MQDLEVLRRWGSTSPQVGDLWKGRGARCSPTCVMSRGSLHRLPGTQRAHAAGLRAQKPVSLASQGWVSIVKDYMLPDRSFACSTARIEENASQSNIISLCFDRSGLAVAKYRGAGGWGFPLHRSTRVTHASKSVPLNVL